MLRRCLPLAARFSRVLQNHHAPREIALGAALGTMLGLLPKASIFSLVLLVVLFRCRANLIAALVGTLAFSAIGSCCEPFLHRTGYLVLTWEPIVPIWTWIYNLPLVPWAGFNHTLVMGGICTGAYLFYPVLVLTNWLVERYQKQLTTWLRARPRVSSLLLSLRELGRACP